MISEWLYDKNGDAKLYLDEDKFISRSEKVLGTLEGNEVISPTGEVVGLFRKGVLYDSDNRPVAFIENARGYIPGLSDILGAPGSPDFSDSGEGTLDFEDNTNVTNFSGAMGSPGDSGIPQNPVEGGWSDVTLEDLFGTEL